MEQRPIRITLDTSCVVALTQTQATNDPNEVKALESLVDLARRGTFLLQLTAAYQRDFDRWKDEEAKVARLEWLSRAPVAKHVGGLFRLDVSVWDGPDVLVGDAEVQLDQDLRALLLSSSLRGGTIPSYDTAPDRAARMFSDIDHLIAHKMSGAEYFVTLDQKTILNKGPGLMALGIDARKPSDVPTPSL